VGDFVLAPGAEAYQNRREMTHVDSSLTGVIAAETRIAHVDGEQGLALVRGYSLPALAAGCSYEEVAYLVLRGELPPPAELAAFTAQLRRHGGLDEAEISLARGLGEALPKPTALAAAMALLDDRVTLALTDPDEQAARALARVPALAAAVGGFDAPDRDSTYARRCLVALGARRQDEPAARALEVLLSLESEHGLSASTFACRVAASSGAGAGVALGAGVATLTGPLHGGATAEARGLLLEAEARGDVGALVREARERRRRLPGFGHRIYKVADPRVPPLREAMAAMGGVRLLPVAEALEAEAVAVYGSKGVHANIDLFSAALLDGLGVDPAHYVAAFALGLASGWLAHWAEQRATGRLIRPTSLYAGPAERPVGRSPREPLAAG
jgi:citrate synthase